MLPFGRISPAAKPGWPVTGPAFWVCRAKSGAAFRCAKPPCAVVRFAAMASPPRTAILPFPSRLRRAGAPTAKPRPLLPFGRISPAAKPRGRSSAPPGPLFCRSRHGSAAPGPQRQNPGACSHSVAFRSAKPRWPVIGPTGADVLPSPSRLRRAGSPTAKPRRLLPFGRISPAAKPRGRSLPPPGATCSLPHFRSAKPRWPVIGPTGADVLPSPSRLRRAGSPTAKPRRLLPFGRISPAAKPRGRSLPPLGATCSLPHFRSAQMWPHARTPALAPVRSHFAPRNRAAGHRPHRGRCFAVPVTAPPRRVPNGKTPALLVFNPVFSAQKPAGASPRFRTAGR